MFYADFVLDPDQDLPLRPPNDPKPPLLAPAWVPLLTVWLGVAVLIAAIVFVLLPGTVHPRQELEHLSPYSLADRFLPLPIYGVPLVWFLGSAILWQMRKEPRPLPPPMVAQRVQAWVGMTLALLAAVVIYAWVGTHPPR